MPRAPFLLMVLFLLPFPSGCKQSCLRNSDCNGGESCSAGVCLLIVKSDGATDETVTTGGSSNASDGTGGSSGADQSDANGGNDAASATDAADASADSD